MVADLLADELLRRAPKELSEFLLRTSVADVLDAELCDTLSGRSDSAEVLRRMEADLQFVMATGPGRDTWRYHPLLAEMLRSELQAHRPDEVQELNHLAAVLLQARGDIAGAVRCLLAAGDTDRAFSLVFEAAYRRADLSDTPGIAAFINLFPQELVTESASRMLTYALMLGLAGQVAEAHAWLQRAQMRISDEPTARAEDVATLDVLRLLTFTVSAGAGDEIDAGRRAVEAVEAGLDLGVAGARARMNLVRGYLLVDEPGEADSVLRAGSPGDEIAALVLAPALAARIALREGRLSEAGRQATAALEAAQAFGLDTHPGAVDAHLALAGALIDRNELADATAAFRRLDEVIQANPFTLVYQVLVRLEKVRVAAALNDFDNVFATVGKAGKLIDHLPRSALRCLVDAAAARWHLEAGQTRRAERRRRWLAWPARPRNRSGPSPAPSCRWRWVPLPVPQHAAPADANLHRTRAVGAAVPAHSPHQCRDRRRMLHVGEHGQDAPEEHLRQTGGHLPRGDGRAGTAARPALTGNAQPLPIPPGLLKLLPASETAHPMWVKPGHPPRELD